MRLLVFFFSCFRQTLELEEMNASQKTFCRTFHLYLRSAVYAEKKKA